MKIFTVQKNATLPKLSVLKFFRWTSKMTYRRKELRKGVKVDIIEVIYSGNGEFLAQSIEDNPQDITDEIMDNIDK